MRLSVLDFGAFNHPTNGRRVRTTGHLVETDHGERILVDTGFQSAAVTEVGEMSRLTAYFPQLEVAPANLATGQLALLGFSPGDVDLIVITHGGVDRIGGLDQFPHVPVVVSGAARREPTRSPAVPWPDRLYRLVEGDHELRPGVRLLATPGHAVGHLSLRVDLTRTGPVVLTVHAIADEVERKAGFGDGPRGDQQRASAERLTALAERERAPLIYGYLGGESSLVPTAPGWFE